MGSDCRFLQETTRKHHFLRVPKGQVERSLWELLFQKAQHITPLERVLRKQPMEGIFPLGSLRGVPSCPARAEALRMTRPEPESCGPPTRYCRPEVRVACTDTTSISRAIRAKKSSSLWSVWGSGHDELQISNTRGLDVAKFDAV